MGPPGVGAAGATRGASVSCPQQGGVLTLEGTRAGSSACRAAASLGGPGLAPGSLSASGRPAGWEVAPAGCRALLLLAVLRGLRPQTALLSLPS